MSHISEEELFRLVDGECSVDEQLGFQAHLQQCRACKTLYTELLALDTQLEQVMLESPSADFTEKLMKRWQTTSAFEHSVMYRHTYSRIMVPFAFTFGLLLLLLWGASQDWSTSSLFSFFQEINTGYEFTGLPSWLGNDLPLIVFMIIMAVLVLLILDKALLQPYVRKKLNQSGKG